MASESPKWIALAFSVLAIAISGLSWWEAHRSRIINEEIARPLLSMSRIYTESRVSRHSTVEPIPAVLNVTLKNNGKTAARIQKIEIESQLGQLAGDCKILPDDRVHDLDDGEVGKFGDVLPGFESVARILIRAQKCRDISPVDIKFRIRVTYGDSGSGRLYFQTLDGYTALDIFPDIENPAPSTSPSPSPQNN